MFVNLSHLKTVFSATLSVLCRRGVHQVGIFVLTKHFELKDQTFTKHDGLNLNTAL